MFVQNFVVLLSFYLASAANIVPYLSNGDDAQITEFPYLVSIQEINVHICGGSLLSERWVLSSARCFSRKTNVTILNIEYGNSVITPGPSGTKNAFISRVISHENFNESPILNDVSLVESATMMVTGFHDTFAKLPLPGGSHFKSRTPAMHAGWGHISTGVRTNVLQKATVYILTLDECVVAVNGTQRPSRDNLCAMSNSVMCTGDLGNVKALSKS